MFSDTIQEEQGLGFLEHIGRGDRVVFGVIALYLALNCFAAVFKPELVNKSSLLLFTVSSGIYCWAVLYSIYTERLDKLSKFEANDIEEEGSV